MGGRKYTSDEKSRIFSLVEQGLNPEKIAQDAHRTLSALFLYGYARYKSEADLHKRDLWRKFYNSCRTSYLRKKTPSSAERMTLLNFRSQHSWPTWAHYRAAGLASHLKKFGGKRAFDEYYASQIISHLAKGGPRSYQRFPSYVEERASELEIRVTECQGEWHPSLYLVRSIFHGIPYFNILEKGRDGRSRRFSIHNETRRGLIEAFIVANPPETGASPPEYAEHMVSKLYMSIRHTVDSLASDLDNILQEAIETLDDARKTGIRLYFFEGLSYRDIVGIMQRPTWTSDSPENARQLIRSGLGRLRAFHDAMYALFRKSAVGILDDPRPPYQALLVKERFRSSVRQTADAASASHS